MGRPLGSRNKPKAADAESFDAQRAIAKKPRARRERGPRVETTEHKNSAPLTDEQAHAILDQSARSYARALAQKKEQDAKFKNACKMIKADGVKLTDVKMYLDAESEEGQARIRQRVEEAARIARWRGFPIGTQFTLALEDQTESHSYTLGKEAGLAGLRAEPPQVANVEEFIRGWHEGQAILGGNLEWKRDDSQGLPA
jgi:demethoxyubiquinone hydroxylase (CLK1/Coq7/Cat5 family)